MNCTRCEYALWNLKDRRCPECGQEFRPSHFKFVPRAVRFCCPHCDQQYFGTGVDGHLVPLSFDCVTCGRHISMDEMVLRPATNVTPEQTQATVNPWLEQRRRTLIGRWLATVGQSMSGPGRLIERTPRGSSASRAALFAVLTLGLGLAMNAVVLAVFLISMGAFAGAGPGFSGLAGAALTAIVGVALWAVGWLVVTHLILALTGPTEGGFGRTVQCMSYSSAPNVLTAVPCVGVYLLPVSLIWQGASATAMIAIGQKVSGWRAAAAVLTPLVVLFAIVGTLLAWRISSTVRVATTMGARASAYTSLQDLRTQSVSTSLKAMMQSNGTYPKHGVELLTLGTVTSNEFVLSTNPLAGGQIVVGGTTLGNLEAMTSDRRQQAIQSIVDGQPAGVVAHRVGDYLFTYHGMSSSTTEPRLWTFVADNPSLPGGPAGSMYFVGLQDGSTQMIAGTLFASALKDQNDLRAESGLAPIPDPGSISTASPMVAPR